MAAGDLGNSHRAAQLEGEGPEMGPHSKPERLVILTAPTGIVESQAPCYGWNSHGVSIGVRLPLTV